jgi:isopentenyldiphosphate isomerase
MSEEYLDILDENGQKTGEKKTRTAVHLDGDWHRCICAWIITPNKEFLIQRRSLTKEADAGKWTRSLTGHIPSGESSIDTVFAELSEELGIQTDKDQVQYLFSTSKSIVLNDGKYLNNEFNDSYLVSTDLDINDLVLQKEEVIDVKLIPFEQVIDLLQKGSPDFVSEPSEDPRLLKYFLNHKKVLTHD